MTWKKLAFYDEVMLADGSVPMTDDLDMGGNMIGNIWGLRGTLSTNVLSVYGGASNADAVVEISGKDAAGYDGDIVFRVPNAAKTSGVNALTINGASDTPIVDIKYGLDMTGELIDNIGDVQADAAAGIVIREYGGNDIGVMAVSGNNDYTMRLKNTDGNDAVDLAGTTYAMIAHYPINMDQKEIDAMVFENLATAPHAASEVQGEVYYDTVDDHLHVWVV